jgi:cyclic pyranopterin phosphate synthase
MTGREQKERIYACSRLQGVGKLRLSHVDAQGKARMVDVGEKRETRREARAFGRVRMSEAAYAAVRRGQGPKGDVFTVAKIAGIMAAKKTSDLVPLCHPLPITFVDVEYAFRDGESAVEITSAVRVKGQTGVEMEAITAVMVTALTIYDMCKAIDKSIELGPFYLLEKSGGKSGLFKRERRAGPAGKEPAGGRAKVKGVK